MNKKLLLSFLIFVSFSAILICADKNFFTIMNGANSKTVELSSSKSSVFVGQAASYSTKDSENMISRASFASAIKSPANTNITFKNNTGSDAFTDINVPLSVDIKTVSGQKITKIRYQIWQGEDVNFEDRTKSPEIDYEDFTEAESVTFSKTVSFNEGKPINFFRVWAKDDSGEGGLWSGSYTVKLSTALTDTVTFTSPDRLTKLATTDPIVETTEYSINLTTVTISLYTGDFASGTPLYEVELSSSTNAKYKMYNTELGKISYLHSNFVKIYNQEKSASVPTALTNNQTYTLKIVKVGDDSSYDTLTFKALSGGVADILTYPSPFNPKKEKIKIRYLLAKDANVTIKIYDKAGKFVSKVIQSEPRVAGTNEDEWDGRNYAGDTLATGPYICEVIAKGSNGENRRYTAFALVN